MATPKKNKNPTPGAKLQITLRQATARDATPLYNVLIRYFDELKLFYPPPIESNTMAWGLTIVVGGGCTIAEADGEIIGCVGLEIGQFPWNPTVKYLNGVWFYVAPERRKGAVAEKLMSAAKAVAAKNGMALRLDNIWGVEPELQDRYRQMHGFQYVGGNHVWFPSPPPPAQ